MVFDAQERISMSTQTKLECRLAESVRALFHTQSVLVGCSGGVDSMVLAAVIAQYSHATRVVLAYVDHQLQNKAEEQWGVVQRFADSCGLQAVKLVVDPIEVQNGGGLEDGARRERFRLLNELKQDMGIDLIALAHHRDDQVETFFIRLTHGSRIYGLRGIEEARSDIIRPFLSFSKSELFEYAKRCRLEFVEDPTNCELDSLRNRIRHGPLPALDGVFGVGWRSKLTQMMKALQLRSTVEIRDAEIFLRDSCMQVRGGYIFKRESFQKLGDIQKFNVATQLLARVLRNGHVRTSQANQFVEICAHHVLNGRFQIARGVWTICEDRRVFVGRINANVDDPPRNLSPGVNEWNEWEISLGVPLEGGVVFRISVDANAPQLVARFPRAGERFHQGKRIRKVSELFSENRVPWRLRKRSLVLGFGHEASFIWGIGAHEQCNATLPSQALLVWIKPPSEFG